jgi:hypothetical protein
MIAQMNLLDNATRLSGNSKKDAVIFSNSPLFRDFINQIFLKALFFKNWKQFSFNKSNFISNMIRTNYSVKPTWRPKNEILA